MRSTATPTGSPVSCVALWGARHPDQLQAAFGVTGWSLDAAAMEQIESILSETIVDAVGPEFMAPPQRSPPPQDAADAT
jgi:hypothetical protein